MFISKKSVIKCFLIFLSFFNATCQVSVGIVPGSLYITPGFTVNNNTTITVTGSFKNTGTIPISSGSVTVKMAINTNSVGVIPNYIDRYSSTYQIGIIPVSGISNFTITDVADTQVGYRADGGGTTVVVWPIYNNNVITTHDSAFSSIYVTLPQNIEELIAFEQHVLKIENPVTQNIDLIYDDKQFKTLELRNNLGQVVQLIDDKRLNITLLPKGLYYLKFYSSNKVVTKKILIQ